MLTKQLFPVVAMLLISVLGGCTKGYYNDSSIEMAPTQSSSKDGTISNQSKQNPVNLGVAGNFAILSKSGITDVYKSSVIGDIGSSPITGAAIHLT